MSMHADNQFMEEVGGTSLVRQRTKAIKDSYNSTPKKGSKVHDINAAGKVQTKIKKKFVAWFWDEMK